MQGPCCKRPMRASSIPSCPADVSAVEEGSHIASCLESDKLQLLRVALCAALCHVGVGAWREACRAVVQQDGAVRGAVQLPPGQGSVTDWPRDCTHGAVRGPGCVWQRWPGDPAAAAAEAPQVLNLLVGSSTGAPRPEP